MLRGFHKEHGLGMVRLNQVSYPLIRRLLSN
jgi:hypothetical protein